MSLITVQNLTKVYRRGKIKAVDNASFEVNAGEVFGLIGPNGAGKTTIFSCLLALNHPTSGEIEINGMSPFDLDVKPLLGFLPERPCYYRWMTIKQFLSYHHWLAGLPAAERDSEVKRVLSLVELDVDIKKRKVRELSRGMLQRLGFAQALIGRPKIFFLDEPTSGMDPLGFILIRKLLLQCKAEGMTIVLNSHHLHEVEKVCDRIAFIRKGKIEEVSAVAELSQIRQILIVSWLASNLAVETILKEVSSTTQCALIDTDGDTAKFSVDTNEKAADIIAALGTAGLRVFKSSFEKRELVDLFLSAPSAESGGAP
ncbi:MAG: ABC transporter ATP-binding protein [Candidatus Obscuribacter sp.]|nr:ABC transporter ATP-binding protein [Candidatus Obscuribacter sp.]